LYDDNIKIKMMKKIPPPFSYILKKPVFAGFLFFIIYRKNKILIYRNMK
jgi:hypothetical protein